MIMSLRTGAHAGVAIRIPIPCRITDIYRENGLPRQSSDWLAMTFFNGSIKENRVIPPA